MKTCKKLLSVLLALVMIIGTISVSFTSLIASAAVPTANEIKTALSKVSNLTNYTTGDGSLLEAADMIYYYVNNIASTSSNSLGGSYNSHSLSLVNNNSTVNLNATMKSALGSTYNTLINALIPTSGVYDDASFNSSSCKKTGSYSKYGWPGFDTGYLSYSITSGVEKTATVKATLDNVLLACASVSDIPSTILLSVTYKYSHSVRSGYKTSSSDSWGKRTWKWSTSSWHTLSAKPSRTVNSKNTAAYTDLNAFNNHFTASLVGTSLYDLCRMSASEINSIISANNTAYAKVNSYSANVKNHFFDMAAVDTFMANCLYAQKVINAQPAITALNSAMAAGYDALDLDGMNAVYTAQKPNLDYLVTTNNSDSSIIEYVAANFPGFDTFSLTAAQSFMVQLDKDIQLFKIRDIKSKVDTLRAQYPDAAAISGIDKDESGDNINDNLTLWTYYDVTSGYYNTLTTAFTQAYVDEVFTDGTAYVCDMRDQFKYEYDYRGAEAQYESFYAWFLPLVYADLTQYTTDEIIGTNVDSRTPNINNAVAKNSAFKTMYASFKALIGDDAMLTIFGSGENALGYIIDDYIARLYSVILARLDSEVSTAVGYYDAYGEINLNNCVTVKESIGLVETQIWTFINANNPSILSTTLKNNYNRLSSLLSKFDSFVATGGLNSFERQHRHDANGVYITREPTSADEARDISENESYDVTEAVVNETITKLDRFLTSNDFSKLVDIDGDDSRDVVLSDFIKETLAENLYTDKIINTVINLIYPALVKALEDLYASLPPTTSVAVVGELTLKYKSIRDIISALGIGLYPNQVAGYVDGGYGTAKSQLASKSTWDALKNSDGDLVLNWGVDSITPDNYSSTAAYLNAKKAKFLGAMAESFDAILPIVRVLLADWDGLNVQCEKAGSANKSVLFTTVSLNGDLTLTADGCAAYSDLVVPVLEALGCTGIQSYDTVKGYTSSRQFVDAIFNPIINFAENILANKPVATICSILPNLAYAISFDKLWPLLDNLNINLKYLVEDSILGINVIDDTYPLKLNELLTKDSLNLDFDISSFNSIIKYVISMFIDDFDMSTLPIINAGRVVTYASLNTNASTLRHTGKRTNLTADKADVFMAMLDYFVGCAGSDKFMMSILKAFAAEGEEVEISDTLRAILDNLQAEPQLAVAAIIELLNQKEYNLDSFTWYDGTVGGTVDGITPAALVYLSETNNWTKATADYVEANLNEIVNAVLETAGSDIDISAELTSSINGIFTNATVTSLAKLLSKVGSLSDKINDILVEELGVDLTAFAAYADLSEDYNWGFADGSRDGFIDAVVNLLIPISPLYGFLFTGKNLTLFEDNANKDIITLYGNEGYDTAVIPLLEALGCEVKSVADYKAAVDADNSQAVRLIIDSIATKLDSLLADPIYGILDLLPGVMYFLTSNGLSTAVRNLLHPLYVVFDTIRPVYPISFENMINEALSNEGIDVTVEFDKLDLGTVIELAENLTGMKLDVLKTLIEDVSMVVRTNYTSASSFVADSGNKGVYTEGTFDRADMITVLISYFLEMLADDDNSAAFDKLIGTDGFTKALLAVFEGTDPEMQSVNWMYYFGEGADLSEYDFDTGITIAPSIDAVTYPNNWTESSADYVNANLDELVSEIVKLVDSDYDNLGKLLADKVDIYNAANVEAVAALLNGLVEDVNAKLLETAGVMLNVDLTAWQGYTASADIDTAEEFAAGLTEVLAPVSSLLNWLLFGEDYKFFTGTKKDADGNYIYNDIITVNGAEGYKYGLIPVLEALGCENIPTADASDDALKGALTSLFKRLDTILADPANEILAILPNVIYFINANGINVSIYNALAAVYTLAEALNTLGTDIDVDDILGADLSSFTLDGIIGYVEDATKLNLTPVVDMFGGLCVGTISGFSSLSGEYAYRMSYSDELDRKDMLTLLITVFVETVKLDGNEETLRGLVGDDVYDAVLNLLNMRQFGMQQPEWLFAEYANTEKTFSAMSTSEMFSGYGYGPLYTQEMAQHEADNIDNFIDNIIYLLGIEIEGTSVEDLEQLLNEAINGSIYNSENAQWLLDKLLGFVNKVDDINGSKHIKALIKTSLGVDLDAWDGYSVPAFEDDRAQFTQAICDILAPLYPVLEWALCNVDISFFVDEQQNDLITLLGAKGYAYGIVPLLEVLGCEGVMSPDAFYAAEKADKNAMITGITEPLFNRLDAIMAAPADEILEMLPAIIYFVNSNGLDTCFKNALHAVYGILAAIEPLVKVDLYELINVRLDEITFATLYDYLLDKIEEDTGYELTALKGDALLELTVGKVVTYTSANGETYYTMEYQANTAKAEMVTITERLVISFVMLEENREKLIGILRDNFNMDAETEKYIRVFLDGVATYNQTTLGMDSTLAAIYYVFYGTDIAADKTSDAMKDVNKKWQDILAKLNKSSNPDELGLGTLLGNFLDMTLDGIVDSDGIASEGFAVMIMRIIELFKKIYEVFSAIFNK